MSRKKSTALAATTKMRNQREITPRWPELFVESLASAIALPGYLRGGLKQFGAISQSFLERFLAAPAADFLVIAAHQNFRHRPNRERYAGACNADNQEFLLP